MIHVGDSVAGLLRHAGITGDRIRAVTGAADCGCDKRRQSLNQWGYAVQNWILHQSTRFHRARVAFMYFGLGLRVLFFGR